MKVPVQMCCGPNQPPKAGGDGVKLYLLQLQAAGRGNACRGHLALVRHIHHEVIAKQVQADWLQV